MSEKILESSISTEYKNDMSRYAIAANRRRSVPDARDGLKIVARRILTDMYFDEHCTSDKDTIKCAGIVGGTMKKYHPHGDCHRSYTLLFGTSGEFYTIGDLYERGVKDLEILAVDQKTGRVVPAIAHSFRIGQYTDRVYHICLSNGSSVEVTGNHPFMLINGDWIKAENIIPGMRLYNKNITVPDGRPYIDGQLLQNLVCDYYYGIPAQGYERHHKDYNPWNNTKNNLVILSKQDHISEHYNNDPNFNKSALGALEVGRQKMFSEGGEFRAQTINKNSALASLYNKDQGFRRFKRAISILQERGLSVTIENYETLRPEIYNLPFIDRLIKKGIYGSSFEELISFEMPSIGELYQQHPKSESMVTFSKLQGDNGYTLIKLHTFNLIDYLLDINMLYYEAYCYYGAPHNLSEYDFNQLINQYYLERPFVVDVQIEIVDQEPMYDFTVDGFENMLIPVPSIYNIDNIPFICVHNSSIYETLVGMATWYDCKVPLVHPHGNFGNMQGDGPAAYRYTGAKLSKFAEECVIAELKYSKSVVDWAETFDNKNLEPEYFPAAVPLLLVNGALGIGVGLMSYIPRHNLGEVIDATINLINNPDAKVVLIPDQCMPCHIIDTNWKAICNTGNGKYRARAHIDIEMEGDIPKLVIKSIPDMVTLLNAKGDEGIIPNITKMAKEGKIPQITNMIDDSHGQQLRYVIELRKGSDPQYVKEYLYKHTQLEKTFTVSFEVMYGIEPLRLSYKAYLQMFIEFRRTTKFRVYTSLYQQAMTKWTEKQLYLRVMQSNEIDDIIYKIRHLTKIDDNAFMEYLIKALKVTDLEAKYIMRMDVMKLSVAYYNKYVEECKKIKADSEVYLQKITNDELIDKEIIEELASFKQRYGTPRVCDVIKPKDDSDIPKGEFRIVITENNYVKKISPNDPINAYRGDNPKYTTLAENTECILIFDRNGKVFKFPVWKIPLCDKSALGIDIRILIKGLTSDIVSMIYEPTIVELSRKTKKHFLVVVTESNCIKKLDLEDFLTITPSGIMYTRLNDNDFVKDLTIIPDTLDLIIYSNHKALRVNMHEIPHYKRSALGVAAMNTKEQIDGLSVIYPDATYIVVVTDSGKINKFDVAGFARSARNKAGSSVIKLSKTENIVSIYGVNDSNAIRVFTRSTITDINVSDVKIGSSISAGEKMIALKGDAIIKTRIIK